MALSCKLFLLLQFSFSILGPGLNQDQHCSKACDSSPKKPLFRANELEWRKQHRSEAAKPSEDAFTTQCLH
eukprot:427081-Rhodomonas_salina.2